MLKMEALLNLANGMQGSWEIRKLVQSKLNCHSTEELIWFSAASTVASTDSSRLNTLVT